METVVKVLMILVSFSFVLKLTGYKPVHRLIMVLICALFVGFSWHFAIEQSRTEIASWLADTDLLLDLAVLLTLDVVLQMAYCFMAVQLMGSGLLKKRTIFIYKLLRFFPGIMIFVVLLYLVTLSIFAFPGVPFARVSWLCALGVFVLFYGLSLALKRLLPEKEIRLELLFLSNALTACLGIIATVNGRTAMRSVDSVDYLATLAVFAVLLVGAAAGYVVYLVKSRKY